jgi:hypothetical protein
MAWSSVPQQEGPMADDALVEQYVHMPHRITVDWSDEDDTWIARFPELRGCVGRGAHPTEAIARLRDEAHVDRGGVEGRTRSACQ